MRGLIDCHMHTRLCGHASGSVEEYAAAAVEQRLAGIIVTEHLSLPRELDPNRTLSVPVEMMETYLSEVRNARVAFPQLEIITGIEADWLPDLADETGATLAELRTRDYGVRVVLGSVHFLGEWAFDDPNRLDQWDGRDVDEVWEHYVTEWCAAAESGLFDAMAHPDLPKKFGHRPSGDTAGLNSRLARSAARAGVIIEVSTAGLRKPVGELYPSRDLLRAFCEAGVPACIGSDAHRPDEVGFAFDEACEALRVAGYEAVTVPIAAGQTRSVTL